MLSAKFLIFLGCAITMTMALPTDEPIPVFGGVDTLQGDRLKSAEEALQTSLTKLAAGDGPSYKLGKIISASHQVVAGSLYKYRVELLTSDNVSQECDVQIWSRSWLKDGVEVTFECPGQDKVVRKHSA